MTGVCRGWGTSKFLSLESIYHISDAVLNVRERVEDCLENLVEKFNSELENFTVPESPCNDTLTDPATGNDIGFFGGVTVEAIVADIKTKFECLHYSYLQKVGLDCAAYSCAKSCFVPRLLPFQPVFAAKDRFPRLPGTSTFFFFSFINVNMFYDYEVPAILPSREDRLKNPSQSSDAYGSLLFDRSPFEELTAESFLIAVFNEYMGCAVSTSWICKQQCLSLTN